MKKKLIGIIALSSVLALASCSSKSSDRGIYLDVCNQVLDTMEAKETKLTSKEINDDFYLLEDYKELTIAKTFVYFIELLYENESYPISDKPVYFTCDYVKNGKTLQYNMQAVQCTENQWSPEK